MIYCHTCFSWKDAEEIFKEFVKENEKYLIQASKRNLVAFDKDGNQHHFISFRELPKWSLGRTYMWNGNMYHSNEPYEIIGIERGEE